MPTDITACGLADSLSPGVDLEVEIVLGAGDWDRVLPDYSALADKALTAAFSIALEDKIAAGEMAQKKPGKTGTAVSGAEVSVLLSDDDAVRVLNRRWRDKDRATNVLSFPAMEEAPPLAGMPWMVGDIVIALETLAREAREQGKTVDAHFSHLLVHGMVHLLGFDHETRHQADRMEALEVAILATLGVAGPYPERDEGR